MLQLQLEVQSKNQQIQDTSPENLKSILNTFCKAEVVLFLIPSNIHGKH